MSLVSYPRYLTLKNIVTLKSALRVTASCEFMHNLYITEIYKPGLYFAANRESGGALRSCTVIQGHRNCYQSKARMRFPISRPL